MDDDSIEYRDHFRENLKSFRMKKGFTQSELSSRANYDATYVGKLERGESSPSMDTVVRIGRALDVNPLELLRPPESHLDIREEIPSEELDKLPFNPLDIQIFDSLPFTMGLVTERGTLVYVNDAFVEKTGIQQEDIQEKKIWELPLWHFEGETAEELIGSISTPNDIEEYLHYRIILQSEEKDSIDLLLYPAPRKQTQDENVVLIFEIRKIDHGMINFPLHIKDYREVSAGK